MIVGKETNEHKLGTHNQERYPDPLEGSRINEELWYSEESTLDLGNDDGTPKRKKKGDEMKTRTPGNQNACIP